MKCPYPDCPGEIEPGEQFCGECGRSLAPEAVQAALAGMQAARTTNPNTTTVLPQNQTYRPPITPVDPPVARPTSGPPVALLIGVGVIVVLFVAVLGLMAAIGSGINAAATPTPAVAAGAVDDTWQFQLADLTADNDWTAKHAVKAQDGSAVTELSVRSGGTYESLGAPEKIVSVIVADGQNDVVEILATRDSAYQDIKPGWVVAENGKPIVRTLNDGLTIDMTPQAMTTESDPALPTDGKTGNQPIFTSLALTIKVSGTLK